MTLFLNKKIFYKKVLNMYTNIQISIANSTKYAGSLRAMLHIDFSELLKSKQYLNELNGFTNFIVKLN